MFRQNVGEPGSPSRNGKTTRSPGHCWWPPVQPLAGHILQNAKSKLKAFGNLQVRLLWSILTDIFQFYMIFLLQYSRKIKNKKRQEAHGWQILWKGVEANRSAIVQVHLRSARSEGNIASDLAVARLISYKSCNLISKPHRKHTLSRSSVGRSACWRGSSGEVHGRVFECEGICRKLCQKINKRS